MSKNKHMTLREARQARGWTIQQLAEASGIGWATIQSLEKARFTGNLITRHRLADALGVPMRLIWPEASEEMGELFAVLKREQRREREHERGAR